MKRGVSRLLIVLLISFLSIGFISAQGCEVKTRATCNTAPMNHIVMGLSAVTSAHGEFPDTGAYPYVLCCDFAGSTTCGAVNPLTTQPANKVIGLSSPSNAHAEIPSATLYSTKVCYGSLECISAASCNADYPASIISLSSDTNAHLANATGASSYSVKICCKGASQFVAPSCQLTSTQWQYSTNVKEGTNVEMIVQGTNCMTGNIGAAINFSVYKKGGLLQPNTLVKSVIGSYDRGVWFTSLTTPGATETYYFNATAMISKSSKASNDLTVVPRDAGDLVGITRCSDYLQQPDCNSDPANVAPGDDKCGGPSDLYTCLCKWNSATSKCEFSKTYAPVSITCPAGYDLCNTDPLGNGTNYCYPPNDPSNPCLPDQQLPTNGNGICDIGEGCYSPDCFDGDKDSCSSGATCQNGVCSNGLPPVNVSSCINDYTLCYNHKSGLQYCYPEKCPLGDEPIEDADTICNIGDGCSSPDCIAGGILNKDTCALGSYCGTGVDAGMCYNPSARDGMCTYHETTTDDCSDGTLQYSWDVTWDGTGLQPEDCVAGNRVIPCAAQVQLPFFGEYQFAGAIILIAAVYLVIVMLRNKKSSRKK